MWRAKYLIRQMVEAPLECQLNQLSDNLYWRRRHSRYLYLFFKAEFQRWLLSIVVSLKVRADSPKLIHQQQR